MPRLPDISSLGERPAPESRRPITGYQPAKVDAGLAEFGQDIANYGDKAQERQDKLEAAYADADFLNSKVTMLDEFSKDQDYTTFEQRSGERMKQSLEQASARISNPRQRELFAAAAQADIARTRAQVLGMARTKEIDTGRARHTEFLSTAESIYVSAPDEATRRRLEISVDQGFKGMVERGYLSQEEGAKGLLAARESMSTARALSLPAQDRLKALSPAVTGEGFDRAMQIVAKNEGGYTESDGASGAPAIYGINRRWHEKTYDEAKRIADEQGEEAGKAYARDFYKKAFWDANGLDSVPPESQAVVFDGVVNHRLAFAKQLVERAKDGASPEELVAMRREEYQRLAKSEKYAPSLPGWMNRLKVVEAQGNGGAGDWTDAISPEKRAQMREQSQREVGQSVRQKFAEIEHASNLGLNVPRSQTEPLAQEARQAGLGDMADGIDKFAAVQDSVVDFARQGLPEQGKRLTALKSQAEAGDLSKADEYGALAKAYEAKGKALKDDPWGYYAGQGVVQPHGPLSLGDQEAVTAQIMERRADADRVRELEQGAYTLPLLTKPEMESLKTAFETANPKEAAAAFASVGVNLNAQEKQAVARTLGKESPLAAAALGMDPESSLRLISGARAKGDVPEAKVREAANAPLQGLVMDPAANESMHAGIYAYYKQLALEAGDTAKEVNPKLLQAAIDAVVGPRVDVLPRIQRLQNAADSRSGFATGYGTAGATSSVLSYRDDSGEWVDANRLEDALSSFTDDTLESLGGRPYASDGSPVPADEIKRNARFVTIGDGVYGAMYPGLGVLYDKSGRIYQFDARKLEAMKK